MSTESTLSGEVANTYFKSLTDFDFVRHYIEPSVLLSDAQLSMTGLKYYMCSFIKGYMSLDLDKELRIQTLIDDLEEDMLKTFKERFSITLDEFQATVDEIMLGGDSERNGSVKHHNPQARTFSVLGITVGLKYKPHSIEVH